MTRGTKKRRELLGLWVALGILAAVAVLAYRSIDNAADTLGWLEHTEIVIQQISDLNAAYARSVSARRAYVVTGDESQLADVRDLDERLARAEAVVRDSVADNPKQLRQLDVVAKLMDRRVVELQAAATRRRTEGVGAETAEGIALTARIREGREKLEAEESQLLSERDARTRRDVARTKLAVVFGTLVSFGILLMAFRRLREEIVRRRSSEEALGASEKFLESIVENLPDMVFVKKAAELRFERLNRAGEELLGVRREEIIGKNDFDFFPRDEAEFFQMRDRETLAKGVVLDIPEEPIRTRNGDRWLHTKKVPVLDESGVPKYLLGISEDITERRTEAAALQAAKDAADAANQELEAFSYSVAHDLRAPLRAISGFSQALEEDYGPKLDAEAIEHLTRVRAAANQMGHLIDGLLGLSRLSRSDLTREKIDLSQIAREGGAQLRDANPTREVEIVVQDGLTAEGDPRLLVAVLDNLLGNAWKFTSKRERARVEVGRDEGSGAFFVRDNGAGFDQTYAHKLFGAFQRLHAAREFEGFGIGLATVQRIIRKHGGRVWAEGEVDRGATIYFTLAATTNEAGDLREGRRLTAPRRDSIGDGA